MHDITSLELGLAIRELRGKVEGSYLKKFYDLGNGSFRFLFHGQGGNAIVYCNLATTLNETSFIEDAGEATNFAIAMRRRIEDSKVMSLAQHSSDRIAVIEVQSRGSLHRIVIEMFGRGNLVLIDAGGKVELCYKMASYKDREVRPKEVYTFPGSNSASLEALTDDGIGAVLSSVCASGSRMISELSRHLNIGPIYLEEVITSAGLDPKAALREQDIKALAGALGRFAGRLAAPEPVIYLNPDGSVLDYSAVPLRKYSDLDAERCQSVNEALDRARIAERSKARVEPKDRRELEEIDASIARQRQLVEEFGRNSAASAESAKAIFQRMGDLNALVARIRELRKPALEELREEFPQLNITEINLKDRKVVVDI